MIKRAGVVLGAVLAAVLGFMTSVAQAAENVAASAAVAAGATDLKDTLIAIGEDVLPFAAAILALTFGWRFAKRFVRGS